jgi:hypothetical protein
VAGSYEHDDKPSFSMRGREFVAQLSVLLISEEGLCSMELVRCSHILVLALFSHTKFCLLCLMTPD